MEERIKKAMEDADFCEVLGEVLYEQFVSDEESFRNKGLLLLNAILRGKADDVLIAICGWSIESLMEMVEERMGRD